MNVLLHCCCGPCSTVTVGHFRALGDEVTGWFFNPNIHPLDEAQRRETAFAKAAVALGLPVLFAGAHLGLRTFLLALASRGAERCRACYQLRLGAAGREAAARGFDAFSTTLLISPYQDIALIGETGRAIAARLGLRFLFADLRERYAESRERARELNLYQQSYCGCLFSSLERARRRGERALHRLLRAAA
jgi:hypothetical protein